MSDKFPNGKLRRAPICSCAEIGADGSVAHHKVIAAWVRAKNNIFRCCLNHVGNYLAMHNRVYEFFPPNKKPKKLPSAEREAR